MYVHMYVEVFFLTHPHPSYIVLFNIYLFPFLRIDLPIHLLVAENNDLILWFLCGILDLLSLLVYVVLAHFCLVLHLKL